MPCKVDIGYKANYSLSEKMWPYKRYGLLTMADYRSLFKLGRDLMFNKLKLM